MRHRHIVRAGLTEFIAPWVMHRGVFVSGSRVTVPVETSLSDQLPRPVLVLGLKSGEAVMSMILVRVFTGSPLLVGVQEVVRYFFISITVSHMLVCGKCPSPDSNREPTD